MKPGLYAAVEKFIEENVSVTTRDLYEALDYSEGSIRAALSDLKKNHRKIYVSGWVWEERGHLLRLLAEYSPGTGVTPKKPPKLTPKDHRRRHRKKKLGRVNSVFQLARCVEDRRVTTRKRAAPQMPARTQPSSGAGSLG